MKKFLQLLFVLFFLSNNLYSQTELIIENFSSGSGPLPGGFISEDTLALSSIVSNSGGAVKIVDVPGSATYHMAKGFDYVGKFPDLIRFYYKQSIIRPSEQRIILTFFNVDYVNNTRQTIGWFYKYPDYSVDSVNWNTSSFPPADGTPGEYFNLIVISFEIMLRPDNNYEWQIWDDITMLYNSTIHLLHPSGGEKLLSGEKEQIKFSADDSTDIIKIEYSKDGGASYVLIADSIKASDSMYEWLVPKIDPTTKANIKISSLKTNDTAESESFRIKPYIITRLDNNGDYITYDIDIDRWNYGNNMNDMFPYSWWFNKFDYQNGIDPFTNDTYPQTFLLSPFRNAFRSDYPDWISFVNAFSVGTCYISASLGVYSPMALLKWSAIKKPWGGSCFGIANANALAFSKRTEFQARYLNYPNFMDPINVQSDSNVIKVITELYTKQFGRLTTLHQDLYYNTTVENSLEELKLMLKEDNTPIRTLYMRNNTLGTATAHCVVPYKLLQNPADDNRYYDLWVWDNSYSTNTNAIIKIDTYGPGVWEPIYGWNGWGGYDWFFLEPVADIYLNDVSLPKFSQSENQLFYSMAVEIDVTEKADILITDSLGNNMGYQNNNLINEIPNALPLIYVDGSEGPPYGYLLGIRDYSIELSNFTSDTVETYFFTDNKAFSYERYDANEQQTDDLLFDGGIEVKNQNESIKSIRLMNIVDGGDDEKVFVMRELDLEKDESVKVINPDEDNLEIISKGKLKTYDIELNHASELGLLAFNHSDVELGANTTHKLKPNWGDFAALGLEILVDEGNDGIIDDTLIIENQIVGVDEHGSNTLPTKFSIEQNYPNPFNASTKISYSIPNQSHVSLKVFDVLGREVATLVNQEQPVGNYEVEFDAPSLTSGIYFYRIQAGQFVETKKMVLMK